MATQSNYDDYDEMAGVDDAIAAQKAAADQEDDTSALKAYSPTASENKPAVKKSKPTVKPAAKPAAKSYTSDYSNEGRYKSTGVSPKASSSTDASQMSVNDRIKSTRERLGSGKGSETDYRPINERFKSLFGMKKGGVVSSASRRADGIATKGKTRGKVC